jgi:hypothetical protein
VVFIAESLRMPNITSKGLYHIIKIRTSLAEKLYKFISAKDPSFIKFGLKRTRITIYYESSTTSRI